MEFREYVLWIISIVFVGLILVGITDRGFDLAEKGKGVQRLRIEACKTVENEGLRVSCIEHSKP